MVLPKEQNFGNLAEQNGAQPLVEKRKDRNSFVRAIEELLQKSGAREVQTRMDFRTSEFSSYRNRAVAREFILGKRWVTTEGDGASFQVDKIAATIYNTVNTTYGDEVWDRMGRRSQSSRNSIIQTFNFDRKSLSGIIPEILNALPEGTFFRVVEEERNGDDGKENILRIHFYTRLEPEEDTKLQRTAQPLENKVVFCGQGEWVLVDGNEEVHTLAGFGRSQGACRYWLIYDPILKRAAATHLDLSYDEEAVAEMRGYMVRSGSDPKSLQLFGSDFDSEEEHEDQDEKTKGKLKTMFFGKVDFDLNYDFQFNVRTGELDILSNETLEFIRADRDATARRTENTMIRFKHEIPHVLTYQSPSLKTAKVETAA